jgi:NADP-dependent 3-hydroxy acid dehydrogenase YdfG
VFPSVGATSGIGECIAEVFVAEGARVVSAGRREEEGRWLEARCGSAMSFIRTDVTDEANLKAMIDHAVTKFGPLVCLLNNAGSGSPVVGITRVSAEHFSPVFETNVQGVIFGMKHAFGKIAWEENLAFRAEIARRVRAHSEPAS